MAFMSDKYESLVEEDQAWEREQRKRKKKEKYKKYRKNVGKAVRLSWKFLMSGLQSFTAGYMMPFGAVNTNIIPNMQQSKRPR